MAELAYAHGFRSLKSVRRAEDESNFKNLIEGNLLWASGGIGIRARLRTVSERVEVRVLSRPPNPYLCCYDNNNKCYEFSLLAIIIFNIILIVIIFIENVL